MTRIIGMARRWKILDGSDANLGAGKHDIEYTCENCGRDALLAVVGLPIAQVGNALVFDTDGCAMPNEIRCPFCRKSYEAA